MKHTRIVVRVGRTQSLENYSNIRPEIEIEALLEDGDDPEVCKAQLRREAAGFVEEEVDASLEQEGLPAKFWTGPRFRVYETKEVWLDALRRQFKIVPPERLLIIAPEKSAFVTRDEGKHWYRPLYVSGSRRALRLGHARQLAQERIAEHEHAYHLVDCSDGDLSRIPAWVFEPVEARHSAQELAAVRAGEWYAAHLGLGTRVGVVACAHDFQADAYLVTVWAEGIEGTRVVVVRHDEAPRFVGREELEREDEEYGD